MYVISNESKQCNLKINVVEVFKLRVKKIDFKHYGLNTLIEVEFQCFTSMSCVFDTSKSWKVSASYSHYASSSGLLISHTI